MVPKVRSNPGSSPPFPLSTSTFWFGQRRLFKISNGGLVHPNSLPPAPSEHLDIPLYCSHSNPARSHAHTEIKTLPATAPGARGGGASRSRGGAAEDSSYRASPTLDLCRNKQRAGEAALGVRWGEGRADYRQVWGWGVKWGLPITARGIRHHKNPPPLSKVLGLSWDVNSAERHGAPFSCAEIERTFFFGVFLGNA